VSLFASIFPYCKQKSTYTCCLCEVHSVLKEKKLPVQATVQLQCAHGHSNFLSPQVFSCQCAPSLTSYGSDRDRRPAPCSAHCLHGGAPPVKRPIAGATNCNWGSRNCKLQVGKRPASCLCPASGHAFCLSTVVLFSTHFLS